MNTIPLIFNEREIRRTVLGGTEINLNSSINISVILLNSSGSHYRNQSLENLSKCGFKSIISVENKQINFNLEESARRFPYVKFISPLDEVTTGELINIGICEADTDYVFVIQDYMKISSGGFPEAIEKKLRERDSVCVCPMFVSEKYHTVPVRLIPKIEKNNLCFEQSLQVYDSCPTVCPYDFTGIYSRDKFIKLGGFDYTITSPYWQNMDFSMRSWLWGETITIMPVLRTQLNQESEPPDSTIDESYLRFFLKNVAPKIRTDYAYIPINSFFNYFINCRKNIIEAFSDFRDARRWVNNNRYRFKNDVNGFVENWEKNK
jgi:hypothetical protein